MRQKTLERMMCIAFIITGIYFVTNFILIADTIIPRNAVITYLEFLNLATNISAGVAMLIAGFALWIDSRSGQ